jgi:hypothetical protein
MTKKSFPMNIRIADGDPVDTSAIVTKRETIRIVLDYPLEKAVTFTFHNKGGFSLAKIIFLIQKTYRKIYENTEKYEVWGHGIGELFLESISINGDLVEVGMGS